MKFLGNSVSAPFACPSLGWGFSDVERRFLWRVEVNQDIRNAIEAGNQPGEDTEDLRRAILAGRRHALNNIPQFNQETVDDIGRSIHLEEGAWKRFNEVGRFKERTRNRVRSLLEGINGMDASRIDPQSGISDAYNEVVGDIFDASERSQNTIADVDFAIATLDTTKKRLKTHLDALRKREDGSGDQWFRSFSWKLRRKRSTMDSIFDARRGMVEDILKDVDEKLKEKKSSTERFIQTNVDRIKQEMEIMSPSEKSDFLRVAQMEIDSQFGSRVDQFGDNRNFQQSPNGTIPASVNSMLEDLTPYQRVEVFRLLKIDQTVPDRNLRMASADDQRIKNDITRQRRHIETTINSLNYDNIKTNIGLNLSKFEGQDHLADSGFIIELRSELDHEGVLDRSNLYPQTANNRANLTIPPIQEFAILCRIIEQNQNVPGTNRSVINLLSVETKRKLAEQLKFIQGQEGIANDEDDMDSNDFVNFRGHFDTEFNRFDALVTQIRGQGNDNLHFASTTISNSINDNLSNIQRLSTSYGRIEGGLSSREKEFLDKRLEKLKKIEELLKKLKEKLSQETHKFNELEKKRRNYQSNFNNYQTRRNQLGGVSQPQAQDAPNVPIHINHQNQNQQGQNNQQPAINLGGVTVNNSNPKNQATIDRWKNIDEQMETSRVELVKALTDAGVQNVDQAIAGNTALSQNSYSFSFSSPEVDTLFSEISGERKAIADDLGQNRIRRPDTNINNFRNYLTREANKSVSAQLDKDLEENRKKLLRNLKEKQVGSALSIEGVMYQHGNPPTSETILSGQNRIPPLQNARVLFISETGVTLSCNNQIIVIQEGESSGRVEMVSFPVPANSGIDLDQDGLPKGFELGAQENFVATPTSIFPA